MFVQQDIVTDKSAAFLKSAFYVPVQIHPQLLQLAALPSTILSSRGGASTLTYRLETFSVHSTDGIRSCNLSKAASIKGYIALIDQG